MKPIREITLISSHPVFGMRIDLWPACYEVGRYSKNPPPMNKRILGQDGSPLRSLPGRTSSLKIYSIPFPGCKPSYQLKIVCVCVCIHTLMWSSPQHLIGHHFSSYVTIYKRISLHGNSMLTRFLPNSQFPLLDKSDSRLVATAVLSMQGITYQNVTQIPELDLHQNVGIIVNVIFV